MIEIGERLKSAREEKGMSIEKIEEITKIRSKYLISIEAGDFTIIPEEVYLKGFIKNYAECVGLDGSAIIREYNELCKIRDTMKLDEIRIERSKKTKDFNDNSAEKPKGIWILIIALVIIIGGIVASLLLK